MYKEKIKMLTEKNPFLPLNEIVFNILGEDILNCVLMPGERLKEEDLSIQMGVSRTPVREALHLLEKKGFIVKSARKGAIVSDLTIIDFTAMLETRIILEGNAARLAALRITDDEIVRLKEISSRLTQAIKEQDIKSIMRSDQDFHENIFLASKNKYLINLYQQLKNDLHRFRIYITKTQSDFKSIEYRHGKILSAILNRDPDAAESCAKSHIEIMLEKRLYYRQSSK